MTRIAIKQVITVFLLTILFVAQSAKVPAVELHNGALDEHGQSSTKELFHSHELHEAKSSGSSLLVAGTTEYRPFMAFENQQLPYHDLLQEEGGGHHNSRRKLAPFQLCLVCKCCANTADLTTCANMPCCFGIDCQLPNKPFGVCAFVPKTCNCTSCPAAAS